VTILWQLAYDSWRAASDAPVIAGGGLAERKLQPGAFVRLHSFDAAEMMKRWRPIV
jgi:hypothetical protein